MTTPRPAHEPVTIHPTTHVRHTEGRRPSAPWVGGLVTGLIVLMAVILLTYTLLDWEWQQRLGAWNYWTAAALVVALSVTMRRWRPNTDRNDAVFGEDADGEANGATGRK